MGRNTRLNIIEEIIKYERVCSFEQICQRVECSSPTIRRDIKAIEGITIFTHCGKFITLSTIPCHRARLQLDSLCDCPLFLPEI